MRETITTESPKPLEDLISLEIAIKEQRPKKLVNKMLLVKIEAMNRAKGLISGDDIFMTYLLF